MSYALLYSSAAPALRIALSPGDTARVHMPDGESKARLLESVLEARPAQGTQELELLGEPAARLAPEARRRLRRRIAVLTPGMRLLSNLNAWENVALAAAYHGSPPLERVARTAHEVLQALGARPVEILARLPDELGSLERKLVAFARLVAAEPELAVLDSVDEGLRAGEVSLSARFEAEYRARQPGGSVLHVDAEKEVAMQETP